MKLANMHDSKSCAARLVGSTPTSGTSSNLFGIKNMDNQHIIKIGSTFLREYLTKIGELENDKKISDKEAFIARTLGKNAINIWSGLFSDKRCGFSQIEK